MWQFFPVFGLKSTFTATKCSLDLGRIRRNFKNADLDIKTGQKCMTKMRKVQKNHTVFSKYPPGVYLFASSFIISSPFPPPLIRFFCKSTCIFLIFVRFIFATALLHYLIGCQNRMSKPDSIIEKSKTKSQSDDINEVTKEPLTTAYETV